MASYPPCFGGRRHLDSGLRTTPPSAGLHDFKWILIQRAGKPSPKDLALPFNLAFAPRHFALEISRGNHRVLCRTAAVTSAVSHRTLDAFATRPRQQDWRNATLYYCRTFYLNGRNGPVRASLELDSLAHPTKSQHPGHGTRRSVI